jgi:hypothetical protein
MPRLFRKATSKMPRGRECRGNWELQLKKGSAPACPAIASCDGGALGAMLPIWSASLRRGISRVSPLWTLMLPSNAGVKTRFWSNGIFMTMP